MRHVTLFLLIAVLSACAPKAPPKPQYQYFNHTVTYQGETLGLISSWYTGSPNNWKEIADHNPGIRVNAIRLGDTIQIPDYLVRRQDPLPRRAVASYNSRPDTAAIRAQEAANTQGQVDATAPSIAGPSTDLMQGNMGDQANANQMMPNDTTNTTATDVAPMQQEAESPEEKQKAKDDLIDEILKN